MSQSVAGTTVLLVDPDVAFVDSIRGSLEGADAEIAVRVATDAATARRAASEVECVVSPQDLPDATGTDLLETIRSDHPELPFVLVVDEGSEAVAATAIEHDVTAYYREETIRESVSTVVERIRSAASEYAQRVRNASEHRYELVADVATDAFFTVDLRTGHLQVSDGIEQFGYGPAAAGTTHDWWVDRLHPEDAEWMVARHEAATTPNAEGFEEYTGDRGYFENEFRWRRADGSYATVVARGVTIFEDDEAVEQVGTMRDVTAEKEREEELELFRKLIDESNALVYINDPTTGDLLYANETACETLGYSREELLDRNVPDIETTLENEEEMLHHFEDVRSEGRLRYEGRQRRKDGTTFPVEVNLASVSLDSEYVVAIARDVSDRVERERELERQNARLDRFASVLSHDLQNPLTVAQGYLEMARDDPTDDHFDRVETALDRMEQIIDDVLFIARGGEVKSQEIVDLGSVATETWAIVSGTERAELAVDPEVGHVRADRSRLFQLLENLFDNAIEHSQPPVSVRVEPLPDGFAVADDGPGIPESDRERIFDPGYTTRENGTGLGVAIVDEIADGHGWDVTVSESDRGGTRFEFTDVDRVDA
ncbi:MAG: PAS domain S-box protein [Halanaeroarchaeum sp.]